MISTNIKSQVNKEKTYCQANLSILFKAFTLPLPPNLAINKDDKDLRSIKLWGILAKKVEPPDSEVINWLLVNNTKVGTTKEAIT